MTADLIYCISIIVASAAFSKISKYVSRPTTPPPNKKSMSQPAYIDFEGMETPPPNRPDGRTLGGINASEAIRAMHRISLAARGITFEQWIKEELEDAAKGFYNEEDLVTPINK